MVSGVAKVDIQYCSWCGYELVLDLSKRVDEKVESHESV